MQVIAAGIADGITGRADLADDGTCGDLLSLRDTDRGKMHVNGDQTVAVIDIDTVAAAAVAAAVAAVIVRAACACSGDSTCRRSACVCIVDAAAGDVNAVVR